MATFAIGDVQGCFRSFLGLLRQLAFDPTKDRLWLAGDLVNRGPDSLGMLRWAVEHQDAVTAVLGNHDIHLLARAANAVEAKKRDTLDEVLRAPDRDRLLAWLAARPLVHEAGPNALLHGGMLPAWSLAFTAALGAAISQALQGGRIAQLYAAGRRVKDAQWSDALTGDERLGTALRIMTNVRVVDGRGQASFDYSGPPAQAPLGFKPWYARREAFAGEPRVYFGHWSALGYHRAAGATCLDTGCVWGQTLTGVRLDDGRVFHQASLEGST